jgi:hypothetical protein
MEPDRADRPLWTTSFSLTFSLPATSEPPWPSRQVVGLAPLSGYAPSRVSVAARIASEVAIAGIMTASLRGSIDWARQQSSSIPDADRLFVSRKTDFPEIGTAIDDPGEGERACAGIMLMTLKMLMPECNAIVEMFVKKQGAKIANEVTKESRVISPDRTADETLKHILFSEQQGRAIELISMYKEAVGRAKNEDEFLMRLGLATRSDFFEALACESDPSRIADLKLWSKLAGALLAQPADNDLRRGASVVGDRPAPI